MSQIEELQEYIWINRGTRAVFIDFTTYNANINLFCMVKIIFEVLPTGGVLPSFDFSNQKLISYVDAWDFVILVFEILFVVYFIFYTIEEFYEITYFKWHYLTKFWNWIDLIILVASVDILSFSIIICTVFVGFAEYAHLKFGNQVNDWKSLPDSVFSLLRSIVGEFDYAAIERSDPVFGPLFFFAFLFFIFFILINMYLAIIIDAYANVRSEVKSGGVKTHLSDLISRFFNTFLRKIGCKRYAENRERKAEAAYNKAVYQDIRQFFLRCGYTDKEIDIFFAKYEITEESLINPEEMNKVIQKIQETPIRGPVGAEIPDRINMDNLQNFSFVLF
uniref:Polycystin cation channel PKD1/PKD2 domain-containing protein n=1 Tax=Clastoptera arizonana TaxID=38151 RepID=A0A1B6E4N0_9HEMI